MVYVANEWGDTTPRTCVLCVDNQAAVSALIKGGSSSGMAGALVNLVWNVAARDNARWWIEYVNAKANTADGPSRQSAMPNETARHLSQCVASREFREAFAAREAIRR